MQYLNIIYVNKSTKLNMESSTHYVMWTIVSLNLYTIPIVTFRYIILKTPLIHIIIFNIKKYSKNFRL